MSGRIITIETEQEKALMTSKTTASFVGAKEAKQDTQITEAQSFNTKIDELKATQASILTRLIAIDGRTDAPALWNNQNTQTERFDSMLVNDAAIIAKQIELLTALTSGNSNTEDIKTKLNALNSTQLDAISKFEALITYGSTQATGAKQDSTNQRLDTFIADQLLSNVKLATLITDQLLGNTSLATLVAQDAATGARADYANQRLDNLIADQLLGNTSVLTLANQITVTGERADYANQRLDDVNTKLQLLLDQQNGSAKAYYSAYAELSLPSTYATAKEVVDFNGSVSSLIKGIYRVTCGASAGEFEAGECGFAVSGFSYRTNNQYLVSENGKGSREINFIAHYNGGTPPGLWSGTPAWDGTVRCAYLSLELIKEYP